MKKLFFPKWARWPETERTILSPREQRIYGLIHIWEGLAMVIMRKKAPSLILPWIINKSQNHHREENK